MRSLPTIAHLSDLHFGRHDPAIVEALSRHLNDVPPDLVVVSGDFTQRAREGQYRAAARFFFSLPEPRLAVPGNHDLPLYHMLGRSFWPLRRYRRHIHGSLRPVFDDGQLCVVGINTTRRFSPRMSGFWKDGIARADDMEFATHVFSNTTAPVRILVMHHPLRVVEKHFEPDIIPNARETLARLAAANVDAILYGHIHIPHALIDVEAGLQGPRAMLCMMAGTSTSFRRRLNFPQSYNRIWIDGDRCSVEVFIYDGKTFSLKSTQRFARDEMGWRTS